MKLVKILSLFFALCLIGTNTTFAQSKKIIMKNYLFISILTALIILAMGCSKEDPDPYVLVDGLLYNFRYCEILTAQPNQTGQIEADVYNTMGCNMCPQTEWDALDFTAIAADYNVMMALPNGPRYWVLDSISSGNAPSMCSDTFGDITMTLVTSVAMGGAGNSGPYQIKEVARSTTYTFKKEREVYTLQSDEGKCYIMQSFSQELDNTLQLADLTELGSRLTLPDGWSFTAITLDEEFTLANPDNLAQVITDDLKNTYQYLYTGCLN